MVLHVIFSWYLLLNSLQGLQLFKHNPRNIYEALLRAVNKAMAADIAEQASHKVYNVRSLFGDLLQSRIDELPIQDRV